MPGLADDNFMATVRSYVFLRPLQCAKPPQEPAAIRLLPELSPNVDL